MADYFIYAQEWLRLINIFNFFNHLAKYSMTMLNVILKKKKMQTQNFKTFLHIYRLIYKRKNMKVASCIIEATWN